MQANKAVVALVGAFVAVVNNVLGIPLPLDKDAVDVIAAVLTFALVYLVPNAQK